ncbi:MAG: methyltransferase domain-containing protein [Candidatus Diapherotrites archaeon]|jgi:predicted SAM-dependent methyltransferase|uniref:Methyltransferase domain-containing protein n=1 Tax=Candidatus Iainarchaeum sp. TaxID=3101447 RepID=A0A8T5GG33_9ARCH|nr:methyltransferase domain-containing protein [Candidatus Diapherotrites archaeon]
MSKKIKVNLGCGKDIRKGWINVDGQKFSQEVVADLNKPWKFLKDSSVDFIFAQDVMEHVQDQAFFLEQAKKKLKGGGKLEIRVPHYKCPSAYALDHKKYFSWNTFGDYPRFYDPKGLKVVENKILTGIGLDFIANAIPRYYEKFCYCMSLIVIFEKVKVKKK